MRWPRAWPKSTWRWIGCAYDYYLAGRLDAIYRFPQAYNTRESLFNQPAANNPLFANLAGLLRELAAGMPGATFYAPMGIGLHVDHLITHAASREALAGRVRFYEDLPYVAWAGTFGTRMAQLAGQPLESLARPIERDAAAEAARHPCLRQPAARAVWRACGRWSGESGDYAASVAPAGAQYGEPIWWLRGDGSL